MGADNYLLSRFFSAFSGGDRNLLRLMQGQGMVTILGSLPCSYCVLWDVTKDIYHVHIAYTEILLNT